MSVNNLQYNAGELRPISLYGFVSVRITKVQYSVYCIYYNTIIFFRKSLLFSFMACMLFSLIHALFITNSSILLTRRIH